MQDAYTTDTIRPLTVDEMVSRLASRKGVSEAEAAPMILGGELLEKWRSEHAASTA